MGKESNLDPFIGQRSVRLATELADRLNERQFVASDTGVTYRWLNHWESERLLDNNREEGQRWRRFTFVEYVWIRMLEHMRSLGMKIDSLREARQHLLTPQPLTDIRTLIYSPVDIDKLLTHGQLDQDEQQAMQQLFWDRKLWELRSTPPVSACCGTNASFLFAPGQECSLKSKNRCL